VSEKRIERYKRAVGAAKRLPAAAWHRSARHSSSSPARRACARLGQKRGEGSERSAAGSMRGGVCEGREARRPAAGLSGERAEGLLRLERALRGTSRAEAERAGGRRQCGSVGGHVELLAGD
jgi:hypothetical protein